MYIVPKGKGPLLYPKLVAGTFLSRVSFADMFHSLPSPVKHAVLKHKLLYKVARRFRSSFLVGSQRVFKGGYYLQDGSVRKGPSLDEWIAGFTR
jgi:hypothetical protein